MNAPGPDRFHVRMGPNGYAEIEDRMKQAIVATFYPVNGDSTYGNKCAKLCAKYFNFLNAKKKRDTVAKNKQAGATP